MVGPDGETPMSQEFMCHSNLDFDVTEHRKLFGWKQNASRRLFTLSQGQLEIEFEIHVAEYAGLFVERRLKLLRPSRDADEIRPLERELKLLTASVGRECE